MQKISDRSKALITFRFSAAIALSALALSFGWRSFASTPSTGQLSQATPILTYDAGPLPPNPIQDITGLALSGPVCEGTGTPGATCDSYTLTITLPAGYHAANPAAEAR